METIYVVVRVKYDIIRTQENLYSSKDIKSCLEYIQRFFEDTPIFTYTDINTDLGLYLDRKRMSHFWIQEFKIEENKRKGLWERLKCYLKR